MKLHTYNIADITKRIGRAKTTFLRWEKEGKVPEAHRDDKGWRFYTNEEFEEILTLVRTTNYFNPVRNKTSQVSTDAPTAGWTSNGVKKIGGRQ